MTIRISISFSAPVEVESARPAVSAYEMLMAGALQSFAAKVGAEDYMQHVPDAVEDGRMELSIPDAKAFDASFDSGDELLRGLAICVGRSFKFRRGETTDPFLMAVGEHVGKDPIGVLGLKVSVSRD